MIFFVRGKSRFFLFTLSSGICSHSYDCKISGRIHFLDQLRNSWETNKTLHIGISVNAFHDNLVKLRLTNLLAQRLPLFTAVP